MVKTKEFTAKLEELTPTNNNPRQISKKDFETLKKSLRDFPEMKDIRRVVVDENMTILGGHQRVKALEAIGEKTAPVLQVIGLTEAQKREFIIKDNIANGDWDTDVLANEWDGLPLEDWGITNLCFWDESDELFDIAGVGSIADYDEDLEYDMSKLFKERVDKTILTQIIEGEKSGEIRPEVGEILRARAMQCSIFDFGQITKYYRSDDSSETEKELLKRLYLVFITPREAFESGLLEIDAVSGKIFTTGLMEKEENEE